MPTYEFRCPQGHEFEKFYRTIGSAEAQALCPQCGEPAERVMSPAGFAFKGSGFYLTDYGKNAHATKGPKPAASDSAKSESASPADSKSSTEKSAASDVKSSGSGQPSDSGGASKSAAPASGSASSGSSATGKSKPAKE